MRATVYLGSSKYVSGHWLRKLFRSLSSKYLLTILSPFITERSFHYVFPNTINWISLLFLRQWFLKRFLFLQNIFYTMSYHYLVKVLDRKIFLKKFLKIISFCFCFDLSFYNDKTTKGKCFQIYMSNLGILIGFFCNFTKSLISYH